jgi:hypothetical protein
VCSVGRDMLELHGGGGITRGYTEAGANLASLENGCTGGREKGGYCVVFALGELEDPKNVPTFLGFYLCIRGTSGTKEMKSICPISS